MSGGRSIASRAMTWTLIMLGWALMYAPLLGVAAASVNAEPAGARWGGWTWRWYRQLLDNERLWAMAWNTLLLACASTIIATVLGTLLALGVWRMFGEGPDSGRGRARARAMIDGVLHLPVVSPDILFAVGLVLAFGVLRRLSEVFQPGMPAMIVGHVSFQIAFVALVVRARLASVGMGRLEEAARDLYASGWMLARRLTIPMIMPGVAAGALLSFTLSLDDFIISFMTSGPESATLPIFVYSSVKRGLTAEVHAISTVMLGVSVLLVLGLERMSALRNTWA